MTKAPAFFLTAIGAARVIGGPPGPVVPLLLIFHGNAGAESAFQINSTLRELYPSVDQLQIASVVVLNQVPRFLRSTIELTLLTTFQKIAEQIPKGLDPTEYVWIAPDWEGKVTSAFGMQERTKDVGLVLITPGWQIFESYHGNDPNSAALRMVAEALNSTA
jgi:hypothetical protein